MFAKMEIFMSSLVQPLQSHLSNALHYFPLLSAPAILPDQYEINQPLILARTISTLALTTLAAAGIFWTCPPAALFALKYPLLSPIFIHGGGTFLTIFLEMQRAQAKADQDAVKELMDISSLSRQATDRICSSHSAFQLYLNLGGDLDKSNAHNQTLSRQIFSSWTSSKGSQKAQQMLIDTGIDLFKPDKNGKSLFILAQEEGQSHLLNYMFSSGKIIKDIKEMSDEQQVNIWKQVQTPLAIQLLYKQGFNIDVRDEEGYTPLMRWAMSTNPKNPFYLQLVAAALNAKANPLLKNQGKKASELASPYMSVLPELLRKAEEEFGHLPAAPENKSFFAKLPWKPVVYKDEISFRADFRVLCNRVRTVTLTALAFLIGTTLFIGLAPLPPILATTMNLLKGASVLSIPLVFFDLWRSNKEAEWQAVAEYLNAPVPSKAAMNTICQSKEAACLLTQLLLKKSPFLNRYSEKVENLLSNQKITLEVFKLLVDHGADFLTGPKQLNNPPTNSAQTIDNGFLKAARDPNPELIKHLFARGLIRSAITQEMEIKMWSSITSLETAQILKDNAFNPNIQDKDGHTALMELAQNDILPLNQIQILLKAGANFSLVNKEGKTARDLAGKNQALLDCLHRLLTTEKKE
jgi:ankyrin repeat protein